MNTKDVVRSHLPQVRVTSAPVPKAGQALAPLPRPVIGPPPRVTRDRARWIVRLWSRRLGRVGRLGVGLVALSGALYLSAVAPAESRLREATDELKALQERVLQRGARADADRAGPAVELARFYSRFPSDGSLPETLRKIFRLGAQQNLRIDQAEYRVAVQGHKRLFRHDIVFPMTGTYPQIRTFLRLMSAEVPTAAPERVTFEHLNGDPRLVRAKVGLLLFTRRDL